MVERYDRPVSSELIKPAPFQLLQWNVYHGSKIADIINHIKKIRDAANKSAEQNGELQILTLQEVPVSHQDIAWENEERIREALGMKYSYFGTCSIHRRLRFSKDKRSYEDGIGIFSNFPIVAHDNVSLVSYQGGFDRYKERYITRRLLTASMMIPGRQKPLNLGTYHTSPFPRLWRRKQEFDTLTEQITEKHLHIVTGDANVRNNSKYAKMIDRVLPRADHDVPTHHAEIGPYQVGNITIAPIPLYSRPLTFEYKLDHVHAEEELVSDTEVFSYRGPSDHYPVIAHVKP